MSADLHAELAKLERHKLALERTLATRALSSHLPAEHKVREDLKAVSARLVVIRRELADAALRTVEGAGHV